MAVISLLFAYLWEGVSWRLEAQTGRAAHATAESQPLPVYLLDWNARGIFHHLAVGHAALAFAAVTLSMMGSPQRAIGQVLLALGGYAALSVQAVGFASRANRHGASRRAELWIYAAQMAVAAIYAYLRLMTDWLGQLDAYAPIVLIVGAYLLIAVKRLAERENVTFVVRPAYVVSLLASVGMVLTVGWQSLTDQLTLIHPLATWLAAALFTHLAVQSGMRSFAYGAALLYHGGFYLLWWNLGITDPQGFLIPAGLLILWFAQFNHQELPRPTANKLRLAALLILYGSSAFSLLQVGGGLPALILAMTCVLGILAGIALRIRAYLYLGTLFLLLDVADQLVFFSARYALAKWIVGFGLGLLLVALAVLFESRRETVLARIKAVTAELARWE